MTDFNITTFLGIDNTSDPVQLQLQKNGIYLRELLNIDIDDEGMIHRKKGYGESPVVAGSAIHSFWSDGKTALFVDGTTFKRLNKDLTATTLISGVNPNDRMSYVSVNGTVYFGNNSIVGFVFEGLSYPFPEPRQTYKTRMVGGQILEYYNGRLYAANGANLFYSDATLLGQMDRRKNAKALPGRITMVRAVADGMYVSADDKTYFIGGDDPSQFKLVKVLDLGAIEGSAVTVDGDDIGRGASGKAVYWMTSCGPYKGFPGGVAIERQEGRFKIDDSIDAGVAVLKTENGYQQYVFIYQLQAGQGDISGGFTIPKPAIEGG